MKTVDILGRVDGVDDRVFVHVFGQRQLNQNTVDAGVLVELIDHRQQVVLADFRRELMLERRHAGGLGLLALGADIDLTGRIFAHQDHRQAGGQAVILL